MEWVETTDKSVEAATELALDQLGVLEAEAEIEVLEEPRQGMFGRLRGNARVRARVRPSAPPPKADRKRKGRQDNKSRSRQDDSSGQGNRRVKSSESSAKAAKIATEETVAASRSSAPMSDASSGDDSNRRSGSKKVDREPMPEQEQRSAGEEFLVGLLAAFGAEASVSSSLDADGILAFEIEGEGLGLLMGPGLSTLDAIQEVCRNSIQRQADGREYGKVVLDVSGVRAERTSALEDFVREEAQQVVSSGTDVIFEVMSRTDRKIVHDVVSMIDGVATGSVGEDPRRRVVLRRA